jgi:hypothetical protein
MKDNPVSKLVILEAGAGTRIPIVRESDEENLEQFGNQCTLIRINPDFPECGIPERTISIKASAVDAISKIYSSILTKNIWYK